MELMNEDELLKVQLEAVRREHRALDDEIAALATDPRADRLRMTRLKKKKLYLKDRISRLEDQLYPDIEFYVTGVIMMNNAF